MKQSENEYRKTERGERTCLFCGKPIEYRYEEYEKYWECDCPDANLDREILDKIRKLQQQRPKEKFKLSQLTIVKPLD